MKTPKRDSEKFEDKAAEEILLGYDGEMMAAPHRQEEMEASLFQRADGSFYIHRLLFDDREPCGNVKFDLSPEKAAAWWVDHFVPDELRPFLTLKVRIE
jgi:hypothetical protein